MLWLKGFVTFTSAATLYSGLKSSSQTDHRERGAVVLPLAQLSPIQELSPVLFSLDINEMKIMNLTCQMCKYADDMVLVGLMRTGNTVNQSTDIGERT